MRLMYCTNRLILDLKINILAKDNSHENIGLGDWYANIFNFNRRQCLIFTNAKTLATFFVPDLLKKDLHRFHDYFLKGLIKLLENIDVDRMISYKIISEYIHLQIVKTESKSILGSINDFIGHYKAAFDKKNDFMNTIDNFNKIVNEIPMGGINLDMPIERLKTLIRDEYKNKKNTAQHSV